MAREESRHRIMEVTIHLMAWMVVFCFPQMMFVREEGFFNALPRMLPLLMSPALLALVFYANYLWLVPHVLGSHGVRRFLIINVILILAVQSFSSVWNYSCMKCVENEEVTRWENEGMLDSLDARCHERMSAGTECPICGHALPADTIAANLCKDVYRHEHHGHTGKCSTSATSHTYKHSHHHKSSDKWKFRPFDGLLFTLRDVVIYFFLVALAVVLHMSFRFKRAEMARKQAEYRQAETELQSLKNQISPHFLLNTLNNIYALVLLDREKAQESILNLSRLLSHMLYQNKDTYTTLEREVDFLHRYVNLMLLRISDKVRVEFVDDTKGCGQMPIAPLLLISLVENAFKHGICGSDGYVSIHISASKEKNIIHVDIRNSNHPKSSDDKSGHGVGLTLVRRRLELLYPGRFEWEQGVDESNNEYYSIITLHI